MINSLQAGSVGHVHQSPLAAPAAKRTDTQPSAEATSQFDRFLADVLARIDEQQAAGSRPQAPPVAETRSPKPDRQPAVGR